MKVKYIKECGAYGFVKSEPYTYRFITWVYYGIFSAIGAVACGLIYLALRGMNVT